jgi:hypothetical protein
VSTLEALAILAGKRVATAKPSGKAIVAAKKGMLGSTKKTAPKAKADPFITQAPRVGSHRFPSNACPAVRTPHKINELFRNRFVPAYLNRTALSYRHVFGNGCDTISASAPGFRIRLRLATDSRSLPAGDISASRNQGKRASDGVSFQADDSN